MTQAINGTFELVMLGTGSMQANNYFNNNALLMSTDYTLAIDCGTTFKQALCELGFNYADIDGILITHIHSDHVGGLETLAYAGRYELERKFDLIGDSEMIKELWDSTLKGGLELTAEGRMTINDYFNVIELPRDTEKIIGGYALELLKTPHVPQKVNYSVFINRNIFYSADVRFDEKLVYHALEERKCTLAFHDCNFGDPTVVHASFQDLATLPREAQQRIYLMHYGDNVEDFYGQTGEMSILEQGVFYNIVNGVITN
jgi:ribonuclease BN (tRNA processing enzyme)